MDGEGDDWHFFLLNSLFIPFRDHLLQSIKNHLKNILMTLGRSMMPPVDNVDVTVSVIANDNVELACAFIQKKAVEKVDKQTDR